MQQESKTYDSDCDNSTNNEDMSHIRSVCLQVGQKSDVVSIHKFDFSTLCQSPSICMIGKRGSGKTVLTRELLTYMYKHNMIDECIIISPRDKMEPEYDQIADKRYYSYDDKIVEELIEIQKFRIDEARQTGKKPKNVVIVLDDCLSSRGDWVKSHAIREVLFNGRCYRITIILTMQFPIGVSPELRANFDYVFLAFDNFMSNIKRIYEHYAGMFPTFDSFRQVLAQITNDFGFMTITNKGSCNTFLEKIKWHKSLNSQEFAKIPVTDLKKYDKLLEITKKLEEKSCKISELSDAESECSYKMSELSDTESERSHKNDFEVKSVVSTKYDKLENLLLNIAICNNNICKLVATKSVTDNRIDILENIVNSNSLITNFLSNK
jgi:hypothetical protein